MKCIAAIAWPGGGPLPIFTFVHRLAALRRGRGADLKICVLGAGALGCAIGGVLAEAGCAVTLVTRNAAQVAAIERDGLRLVENGRERSVIVRAVTDSATLEVMDVVIVLVKSFHTRQAIESARSIVGPGTVVLSLQNGLGHEDILAEVVGREKVLAGKTYVGGVLLAPASSFAKITGPLRPASSIVTISSFNLPAAWAVLKRCCERAAHRSCSSREMAYLPTRSSVCQPEC
jgi:ketopantoate reductase